MVTLHQPRHSHYVYFTRTLVERRAQVEHSERRRLATMKAARSYSQFAHLIHRRKHEAKYSVKGLAWGCLGLDPLSLHVEVLIEITGYYSQKCVASHEGHGGSQRPIH